MQRGQRVVPWLLIAACCVIFAGKTAAGPGADLHWLTDADAALKQAAAEGKVVLVNIHTSWCGPCRLMQSTTLQNPDLIRTIRSHCVPLSVDGDHQPNLIEQWGVNAFPTQLFLAPDGQVIGRLVGFVSAPDYRSAILSASATPAMRRFQAMAQARGSNEARPEAKPSPVRSGPSAVSAGAPPKATLAQQPGTPMAPANEPRDPESAVRPCDMAAPLAMGGYCPVSMITRAELTQGSDGNCLVYRGHRFLFRSGEERTKFLQNPGKFMPAEDGYCVVTWAEENRWIPGAIKYPAIFGDHVFLFPSDDHRKKFLEDPERYVDSSGRAYRSPLDSATRETTLR